MRLFDQTIVDLLNSRYLGEEIFYVGLGAANFELSFGDLQSFSNSEKISFEMGGKKFIWGEWPIEAPVWLLIGQVLEKFELIDPTILRMRLKSGDIVDFYTTEGPYESHIIQFPNEGDAFVMEIY